MNLVYFNGDIIEKEKAFLPACSRAALLGDGVFTTILLKDNVLFFLDDHLDRLKENATAINISIPIIDKRDIYKLIEKNEAIEGFFRLRITVFSTDDFSLDLNLRKKASILISLSSISPSYFKSPLKLISYKDAVQLPLSKIKTISYLNRFVLKNYAKKKGFDDVVVHGNEGEILEASFANIFWVYENAFYYPDEKLPYFFGITIQKIITKLKKKGYLDKPGRYYLEDIPSKASVFLCSSINPLIPVDQINGSFFRCNKEFAFLLPWF